jgi:hypothetical protein
MTFTSRAALVAAGALAVVLTGPALSADAGTLNWKTLVLFDGAKAQACKVPTTSTGPWKVRLRIDATKATTRVESNVAVMKGQKTIDTWQSGWVAKGHISPIGSVRMPRGSAFTLSVGLDNGQAGNGGGFASTKIPHC